MNYYKDGHSAIIVKQDWAFQKHVWRALRIGPNRHWSPPVEEEGTHLIIAKILEEGDAQGIWIGLKSDPDSKDYVAAMLVPRWAIISILSLLGDEPEKSRTIGFLNDTTENRGSTLMEAPPSVGAS